MDKKQVTQWLYSIPRTELAIKNLEQSLEMLETRRQSPPTWVRDPAAAGVAGGVKESGQESWVEFVDAYPARKALLVDRLERSRSKVGLYYQALEAMCAEPWGSLGKEIIYYKFYRRVTPDKKIYALQLFCTEATFYRALNKAIRFFSDVLPGEMIVS